MARFKVGLHFYQQHTTIADPCGSSGRTPTAWGSTASGVGPLLPHLRRPGGGVVRGWSLLAAMAVDTEHARLGMLVTGKPLPQPRPAGRHGRTVDHLSGGRAILGLGAGWFQRDFAEYGYEYGTAPARLKALEASLLRIRDRLERLIPPPVGDLPILVGGAGERVTLRLVAQHADMWNAFGPAAAYARGQGQGARRLLCPGGP